VTAEMVEDVADAPVAAPQWPSWPLSAPEAWQRLKGALRRLDDEGAPPPCTVATGKGNDWLPPEPARGDTAEVKAAYAASVARAQAGCGICPVRDACLEYAVTSKTTAGVWGGRDMARRAPSTRNAAQAVPGGSPAQPGTIAALPPEVIRRVAEEYAQGESLSTIAEGLTRDGVPTASGLLEWKRQTVFKVLAVADRGRVTA